MLGTINVRDKKTKNLSKIYGIRRSLTSLSSTWERIEDAVGLVANATKDGSVVQNDFDSLYPWSDIISYNYDTTSKKITAYYGDPTFSYDGSNGDVLTKIPAFWWKREQKNGYEYIYIADNEVDGYIKVEEFSLGRYTLSGGSSQVKSISGVLPLVNTDITNFRTYAKKLGIGIGIMDWRYFIVQKLYLVEYADYNSQSTLGKGFTSGNINPTVSGGCNNLGMKSGCLNNDGQHSMIYRGLEDIFGNIFQFIDGLNISSYKAYICYDPVKYTVDKFNGDYQEVGYINSNSDGFASKVGYNANHSLIDLPTEISGSTTTGTCDKFTQNSGNRIVCVGGTCGNGNAAGLWQWSCNYSSSDMNRYIGARLLRYK